MPNALLLINPNSRNGRTDIDPALEVLRTGGLDLVTPADDHDFTETILGVAHDVDLVIVGGGDGTLNHAAEALVKVDRPIGILPLGTANDLARTLELPADLPACAEVIIRGKTRRIDLGEVNGKLFFNMASLGISTEVTRNLNQDLKARLGVFGYAIGLCRAAARRRVIKGLLHFDGKRQNLRAIQISIGNGRYYGGGMTISADADIDDDMLDLVVVPPQPLFPWVHRLLLFRWGRHDLNQTIRHHRVKDIDLDTGVEWSINTDGEVTTSTPARFSILPKALDIFVP